MIEKLVPLKLPPGIWANGTPYQGAGRWVRGNLVRFTRGTIQPIGGWTPARDQNSAPLPALVGRPRAAVAWSTDGGDAVIAIATHERLYTLIGPLLQDITPAGFTAGSADSASDGSTSGQYNAGQYGVGPFGKGSPLVTRQPADTWTLDTFGSWLVAACTSDEKVYVWDGITTRSPAAAPSARAVVVTPERYLVALGAGGNVRRVQWADQESVDNWVVDELDKSDGGYYDLGTNGRIICGRRTRGQTLIWTDVDVWVMTYIGQPLIYRFDQAGSNCGIVGPQAVAVVDTQAFWMGVQGFFTYDGFAKPLPCDVVDYVFSDFNHDERAKVTAVPNAQHNEVWWFYPSSTSTENNRYVCYNYVEGHWTVGELGRGAGVDAGATPYPVFVAPDGVIYEHEQPDPPTEPLPYLESGPLELGEGDNVLKLRRLVPDELTLGDVELTVFYSMYPTEEEKSRGPYLPAQPTPLRITARQVRLRFDQRKPNRWRIGTMRVGVLPGGRR